MVMCPTGNRKSPNPEIACLSTVLGRLLFCVSGNLQRNQCSRDLLNEFKVRPEDLEGLEEKDHDSPFGQIERDGKTLYRYRASDVRLYFEVSDDHQSVIVHRVLNRNTFQDFLFRANLPIGDEEDALANSKQFWALIEEGERARRV
jgi:mRNA-degrading endonuclease RelE of RelBE toxin-antitoxin system